MGEPEERRLRCTRLRGDLGLDTLQQFAGLVFHVTTLEAAKAIIREGAIHPNGRLMRASPFGRTETGFFRLRGCVSLFDCRAYGGAEWSAHFRKCSPLLPLLCEPAIVLFVLRQSEYGRLVPWTLWKETRSFRERVVPHVECGYRGSLRLVDVSEIIVVTTGQCSGSGDLGLEEAVRPFGG